MFNRSYRSLFSMVATFVLVMMLVLATSPALMAAPASQESDGATISDVLTNPTEYEEQTVTVSGDATVLTADANYFILSSQDSLRLDRLVVLAPQEMIQDLINGDSIEVTGTIRQFLGDFGSEVGLELSEVISDTLQGRPVLVAESVSPTSLMPDDIVLQVGDQQITREEFDQRFMHVVGMIAAGQNMPITEETWQLFDSLRGEYLEQLADEEALQAEAGRRGITILDEELQAQIDEISSRFESEEAYQSALEASGFQDEEAFLEFIRRNELLRRVGEELQSEISVTEQDVIDFYEANPELFLTETGPAPLERVQEAIEIQLERQLFGALLAELRETLEVQTFVENLDLMEGNVNQ